MKIYLCCPECGGTDFVYKPVMFECLDCGELVLPEDMGAVTSEGEELY